MLCGDGRQVRQDLAQPRATAAVLREPELGRCDRKGLLTEGHRGLAFVRVNRLGDLFAEPVLQTWLVVEHVHLRRAAGLEQINHPFGGGLEVRRAH